MLFGEKSGGSGKDPRDWQPWDAPARLIPFSDLSSAHSPSPPAASSPPGISSRETNGHSAPANEEKEAAPADDADASFSPPSVALYPQHPAAWNANSNAQIVWTAKDSATDWFIGLNDVVNSKDAVLERTGTMLKVAKYDDSTWVRGGRDMKLMVAHGEPSEENP
ncbi:unnamed protein product, partial [Symbiodinium sp. KB8]